MDQETANKLFHEYGWLLLLNYPSHLNFNIDTQLWVTNEKFMGLKLIPPGAHYIHFSEKGTEYGEKFGFFQYFTKGSIIIKSFNEEYQCFESLKESEEIAYAEGVRTYQFDQNLGAYSQNEHQQWTCLSNFITKEVIERLEPVAKLNWQSREIMNSVKEKVIRDKEDEDKHQKEQEQEDDELMGRDLKEEFDDNIINSLEKELKEEDEKTEKAMKHLYKYKEAYGNVFFTDIPLKKIIHGFSHSQITQSNFDKSTILLELPYLSEFLGEMQFAFILFYVGQNFEGFEQWKKMLYLISHCENAISSNKDLFLSFVPVIYEQLDQLPEDFFDESTPLGMHADSNSKPITQNDNFVLESINTFYEIWMSDPINGNKISKKLKSRVDKLKSLMLDKFGIKVGTEEQRLDQLILKSRDIAHIGHPLHSQRDGHLHDMEAMVNERMEAHNEFDNDSSANINENTFDDEHNHNANKITQRDIEILKRQLAIEGDEYMPAIVNLDEKLIDFD